MINIAELVTDPDFAQPIKLFTVSSAIATAGMAAGEVVITHTADRTVTGVLTPNITPDEMVVVPEGMRGQEMIKIYVVVPLTYTSDDSVPSTNDFIRYKNRIWKMAYAKDWSDQGYWMGIAVNSPRAPIGDLV
ncbi:MAG: hypothetical protein E6R08_06405 [Nevskiaceae bacterium]|nr:MAG: hypothetical protein E6R08_06405 [Nevskiaceae bacterium]